ncbi:MAG: hypothetical protein IT388_09600, partial [Nitrospirales bacterium]|nr:hypothetical protein [Nitrospirales bacterium]
MVITVLSGFVLLPALLAGMLVLPLASPVMFRTQTHTARYDEESLYRALKKVEASTRRWTGEEYGEIYTAFSRSLAEASAPYRRVVASPASPKGRRLAALYGEYREA